MIQKNETKDIKLLWIMCGLIFLAMSPWVNKDSLVVPKVILLFITAMFYLPSVIVNLRAYFQVKIFKFLILINLLIFIQMFVVLVISKSPIEQQIFGLMGRGLGIITFCSLGVLLIVAAFNISEIHLNFLLKFTIFIFSISSLYSVLQSYGLDFIKWETKTNAIFGTLGNPNFQSSAAAMILAPIILTIRRNLSSVLIVIILTPLNIFVIYKTQSVQGIIGIIVGISMVILILLYYRAKKILILILPLSVIGLVITILGMLNQGPLKGFTLGPITLYKASVESRGDFWRSAMGVVQEHPFFGVGMDSFGDYFLKYRDEVAVNHSFAENTNNSHNYFLEYAVTGGITLLILQLILIVLTIWAFGSIVRRSTKFNAQITSFFAFWLVFQSQAIISPGAIGLMAFGSIFSGAIIGLWQRELQKSTYVDSNIKKTQVNLGLLKVISIFVAILIMIPYFNTDRFYLKALNSKKADLLIESTRKFPESTLRYSTASRLLLESKLYKQSLEVAYYAIEFNPRNVSPWAHIFLNPLATYSEKEKAKQQLIRLDPNNKSLKDLKIDSRSN